MDITSLIVVGLCFTGLIIAALYEKASDKISGGVKAKARNSEEV